MQQWPAVITLDSEHRKLYVDFTYLSLSADAQQRLENMLQAGKYEYQSDLAKHLVAEGRAEGEARGRSALLLKLLTARFGPLPESAQQLISEASIEDLDAIGERLLQAKSLQEALRAR